MREAVFYVYFMVPDRTVFIGQNSKWFVLVLGKFSRIFKNGPAKSPIIVKRIHELAYPSNQIAE